MLKKFFAGLGMLLLFVAPVLADTAAPATGPAPAADEAAAPVAKKVKAVKGNDEAGIKKAFSEISDAWAAGDAHAMASHWLPDGSLINPFGKDAWSRAEVEQVAGADIQMMKGSTQTFDDFKIRFVLGGFALVDTTGTVSGMKNPDGTAAPDHQFHIYAAVVQRGTKWFAVSVRPYAFVPMPGAAPAAADVAAPPAVAAPSDKK